MNRTYAATPGGLGRRVTAPRAIVLRGTRTRWRALTQTVTEPEDTTHG